MRGRRRARCLASFPVGPASPLTVASGTASRVMRDACATVVLSIVGRYAARAVEAGGSGQVIGRGWGRPSGMAGRTSTARASSSGLWWRARYWPSSLPRMAFRLPAATLPWVRSVGRYPYRRLSCRLSHSRSLGQCPAQAGAPRWQRAAGRRGNRITTVRRRAAPVDDVPLIAAVPPARCPSDAAGSGEPPEAAETTPDAPPRAATAQVPRIAAPFRCPRSPDHTVRRTWLTGASHPA